MRYLAVICYVLFLPIFSYATDAPSPVKVYCFSADLEAGFKDSSADFFCRELAKRGEKKASIAVTDDRTAANVLVEFLGRETIETKGEATYLLGGYAWTPNQFQNGVRVVLKIGDFTKGFYGRGVNDVAFRSAWEQAEKWIRENRDTILQKANEK